MAKWIVLAGALTLLAACATAEPEPEAAVAPAQETQAEQIERMAAERLDLEPPESLPADLQVSVLELNEEAGGLFYKVELLSSERRRNRENHVLYGRCPATDIPLCADQIVTAARMLKK